MDRQRWNNGGWHDTDGSGHTKDPSQTRYVPVHECNRGSSANATTGDHPDPRPTYTMLHAVTDMGREGEEVHETLIPRRVGLIGAYSGAIKGGTTEP